jgi:hypothetical protein
MCASAKFRGDLPNGLKVEMHTHLVKFISYSLINSGDPISNDACVCQFVSRSDFSPLQFFKPMN